MITKIKKYIRKCIGARDRESIQDTINRKKVKIEKIFFRKRISEDELKDALIRIGIESGDNLMIHCSWRQCYNYEGNPETFIKMIKLLIGSEGTLLMPSYGDNRYEFNVEQTKSNAGVLSEVFRLQEKTYRSRCTHFSVCASGKNAIAFTKDHFKSEYGFDKNSPYYKFAQEKNSKILFIGLGKEPTKISLFHCAGYLLKDQDNHLKRIFSKRYISTLIVDGKKYEKNMIIRVDGHGNNNKVFKKIFRSLSNIKHIRVSNLDLVVIDAKEGLEKSIEFAKKGIYCYK